MTDSENVSFSPRPVAGVINICPIGFELGRERLLDTVQHEIFHALVSWILEQI